MNKRILYFIVVFSTICSSSAYSQVNCDVPFPPVLSIVSVQPETGKTVLYWTLSPSSDISAYILYTYKNGDGMAFDTVWNPFATSYSFNNISTKYFSESYVIAAYRSPVTPGVPGCPSQLSNTINTIFASVEIDTCNSKLNVLWNSYPSFPKIVHDYSVLMSVNGSDFNEVSLVNYDVNSYILNDFITDADYCFVVRANLEGGAFSTSNKACLYTRMQRPPEWINADYATVNSENTISLSFTYDPLSEITHFLLERKSDTSTAFSDIAQITSINGSVDYTDDKGDINVVNYYKISAINNCNNPIKVSNICSNLVLSLDRSGNDLNFSWNSYKDWLGKVSHYSLYVNTGNGFEEKAVLEPTDTLYTILYQNIMYEVTVNELCFYIIAAETDNPYNLAGHSQSNQICAVPTEIITVPNVFTPNSGSINSLFKPVLSFTPLDYHLIITDRQGKILFESRDYSKAWDGISGNSQLHGVFLWFLKVTTPSGKSIFKTGTITTYENR